MVSSSGETAGAVELDLCGEVCPYTFVRTRLALEPMEPGAILDVLVDHEPATRNVPRSVRQWGQEFDSVVPLRTGLWRIRIIKRTPADK
jgi:tRNA 2-thiouridine synthesizing protein A